VSASPVEAPLHAASAKEPLTRDAIITTARRLLRTVGFDQTSLRRLATELGVTAPALYAHVTDKGDLLAALADTGFRELAARFDAIDADGLTDPLLRARTHSLAYVDQALDDPDLFRVMFLFRPGSIDLPGVDNVLPSATVAFERAADTVAGAIAAGVIHPSHDPLTAALTLWTTAHGVATVLLMGIPSDSSGRAAVAEGVIDVCLAGLSLPVRPASTT